MDRVIVLDFGGQYSQLIARRIRELGIYSELLPYGTKVSSLDPQQRAAIRGVILSGGPHSVLDAGAPRCEESWFQLGVPMLGICYGKQLMVHQLGFPVHRGKYCEYGSAQMKIEPGGWLSHLPAQQQVWMSHTDAVPEVPEGFRVDGRTSDNFVAAMSNEDRNWYAIQFHPEVRQTEQGMEILRCFAVDICRARRDWNVKNWLSDSISSIREQVGSERVLCAMSGGVDSSVTASLIQRAVGKQLQCVLVDNGFLRQDEVQQILTDLQATEIDVVVVDAKERFLSELKGVTDPEEKRKRIGTTFVRVFEEFAQGGRPYDFLAQGTLYTDVIESGGSDASEVIKSHHNVGGLPENMNLKLLEPLRNLFKDEVRVLGRELNLPETLVGRQPFPGPGLAVRILGEITEEKLSLLRKADAILNQEIHRFSGVRESLFQWFVALLDVRTVGVQGDSRAYGRTVVLRAVVSEEGMTADWARLPYDLLAQVSTRITNEIQGINRVVYDVTSKPPSTIEWE